MIAIFSTRHGKDYAQKGFTLQLLLAPNQVCVHRDDDRDDDAGWSRSVETRDAGHEAAPGLVRALELDGTSQVALTGGTGHRDPL